MTPDTEAGFSRAALGLGGNVGDVPATMARALDALNALPGTRVVAVSSLYRTPPWGMTDQDWFTNGCAIVETALEPEALLDACLAVERDLKRRRSDGERWGPRTIDIDILTFGERTIESGRLSVPHPRMSERGFVLLPLAEIAPDMVLLGKSVAKWAAGVDANGIEKASGPGWWRG